MNTTTMMKRSILRVKQTFNKAEKSELLNAEELLEADRNVEYLHETLQAFAKKIQTGTDVEKRMKKTFEYGLSSLYKGTKHSSSDSRLFPEVFKTFADIQRNLANEHAQHEGKVDEMVTNPLQLIVDKDFHNISKQKKNLTKSVLDMDVARTSSQNADKSEVEDADNKVEHTRDNLAVEMFSLLSRENIISAYVLQYLKLQQAYYEGALDCLKKNIPDMERKIGGSRIKKIFGTSLEEHLRIYDSMIALPLEVCVRALMNESAMNEEGLFRLASSSLKLKRLKASLDSGCFKGLIHEYRDVHLLAGMCKSYLRELPDPLLTFDLFPDWMQVMKHQQESDRVTAIKRIIDRLPHGNRQNLAYLMQFLHKLVEYHKVNKMTTANMATVVGPSLLWHKDDRDNMSYCSTVNLVVEILIKDVHQFFPEDLIHNYSSFPQLFIEEPVSAMNASTECLNNNMGDQSPKPIARNKKQAPKPPDSARMNNMSQSYPSGSATLNRPPKNTTVKTTVGTNTEQIDSNNVQQQQLKQQASEQSFIQQQQQQQLNMQHHSKSLDKQETDHIIVTRAVHHIGDKPPNLPKAAPRHLMSDFGHKTPEMNHKLPDFNHKQSDCKTDGEVQLRGSKPEVPIRPASLATSLTKRNSDEGNTFKTHVQISNLASKQQPALVNLQNAEHYQPGHDNHIVNKERFLHQQNQHVPQNTIVPAPRPSLLNQSNNNFTSTEKLALEAENGHQERTVRRTSHSRTKSDGNIVDYCVESGAKTPPSPRSLNKPTQPPPPPPVNAPGTNSSSSNSAQNRRSCDSTDL